MDMDLATIYEVLEDEASPDSLTQDRNIVFWSRTISELERTIVLQLRETDRGTLLYFEPGVQVMELSSDILEQWFNFALVNADGLWERRWNYNEYGEIRYQKVLHATPATLLQQIDKALDEAKELLHLIYRD